MIVRKHKEGKIYEEISAKAKKKKDTRPIYDQLKATQESTHPGIADSLKSSIDNRSSEAENNNSVQLVNNIIYLQQNYGNAHVQRIIREDQTDNHKRRSVEKYPEDSTQKITMENKGGHPLEPTTRSIMEAGFKHDFSDVRIHIDSGANKLANQIGAKAFTRGNHIFFRDDAYQPGSKTGEKSIAHELTHVIQQEKSRHYSNADIGKSGDAFEQEANRASQLIEDGQSISVKAASCAPAIQCEEVTVVGSDVEEMQEVRNIIDNLPKAIQYREDVETFLNSICLIYKMGYPEETWRPQMDALLLASLEQLKTRITNLDVHDHLAIEGILETIDIVQRSPTFTNETEEEKQVDVEKTITDAWEQTVTTAKEQLTNICNIFEEHPNDEAIAYTVAIRWANLILLGGAGEAEAGRASELISSWQQGGWII